MQSCRRNDVQRVEARGGQLTYHICFDGSDRFCDSARELRIVVLPTTNVRVNADKTTPSTRIDDDFHKRSRGAKSPWDDPFSSRGFLLRRDARVN
jgi:hypothetical protein